MQFNCAYSIQFQCFFNMYLFHSLFHLSLNFAKAFICVYCERPRPRWFGRLRFGLRKVTSCALAVTRTNPYTIKKMNFNFGYDFNGRFETIVYGFVLVNARAQLVTLRRPNRSLPNHLGLGLSQYT